MRSLQYYGIVVRCILYCVMYHALILYRIVINPNIVNTNNILHIILT